MIRRALTWIVGLFMESHICPRCADDPIIALTVRRRTVLSKCPECGELWD